MDQPYISLNVIENILNPIASSSRICSRILILSILKSLSYVFKGLMLYPNAPCMDYLPTLGETWPHSRGNVYTVDKYSLHGASGIYFFRF